MGFWVCEFLGFADFGFAGFGFCWFWVFRFLGFAISIFGVLVLRILVWVLRISLEREDPTPSQADRL